MINLDIVEFRRVRHVKAEHHLVRETGGLMFLIEVLILPSLLYRNCLARKVRIGDYGTLLHVVHVPEVDVAAFIWEEIDLIGLIDSVAVRLVVIEGLLAFVSPEALTADVVSVHGVGKV